MNRFELLGLEDDDYKDFAPVFQPNVFVVMVQTNSRFAGTSSIIRKSIKSVQSLLDGMELQGVDMSKVHVFPLGKPFVPTRKGKGVKKDGTV